MSARDVTEKQTFCDYCRKRIENYDGVTVFVRFTDQGRDHSSYRMDFHKGECRGKWHSEH